MINHEWKNTPDKVGQLIPTLNKQGFMSAVLDPYTKSFIMQLAGSKQPVLDVGAAYGIATIEMLNNHINVIANDLDEKHLQILNDNVSEEHKHLLKCRSGDFRELDIPENTLAGILSIRVLHFFTGEMIKKAVQQFYKWLQPGGYLCIVVDTIYLQHLSKLIPLFEERLANGEDWPGFIENFQEYLEPQYKSSLPDILNIMILMDHDIIYTQSYW